MRPSLLTQVADTLREWIPATSPVSWSVQVGVAVGLLATLFGMQLHSPWLDHGAPAPDDRSRTASASPVPALSADGEEIYNTRCMSCHQMNGQGVPRTFPPLNESEWVTGDKGRLIRILLDGIQGPMRVKGTEYSGVMPPWRDALNDEEVAQIATYVRSNFGNDAPPVTAEEVAKVREVTTDRSSPWTAKELNQEANQGVPGDTTVATSPDSTSSGS